MMQHKSERITERRRPRGSPATPLERQLNGELSAPRAGPLDAFRLARERFLAGERIDMQQLSAELGLHRTTLYRWVGTRDRLLGEILWSLAKPALEESVAAASRARGGERIARAVDHYTRATLKAPFLRRFLEQEPETALRVITTKDSVLQARSVEFTRALIEEEIERGELDPPLPPEDLAYLIIRIGESYLYTDVITGEKPAPEKAAQAVRALLR
jgi:AcrR family transcriptional regulator